MQRSFPFRSHLRTEPTLAIVFRLTAAVILTSVSAAPSRAHQDPIIQILKLNRMIQEEPGNPDFFSRRAELHLVCEDWKAALEDYQYVLALQNDHAFAELGKAKSLLGLGEVRLAKASIERFLNRIPDHPAGLILRSRILQKEGFQQEAAQSLSEALERLPEAQPDLYLERARIVRSRGHNFLEEALAGLDEGLEKLGPVVSLQMLAIEIELEKENFTGALDRLEAIEETANRKERWQYRRGQICLQAGRCSDARAAFREALAEIEKLPARHRYTKPTEELRNRIAESLSSLEEKQNEVPNHD